MAKQVLWQDARKGKLSINVWRLNSTQLIHRYSSIIIISSLHYLIQ